MKDVVYLNFAQLSYFNWHKLKPEDILAVGVSVESLIDEYKTWGILLPKNLEETHKIVEVEVGKQKLKLYNEKDKRLFMKYSESVTGQENEIPKYEKELSGWEFLYAADHNKIYKDYLGMESERESGFQASAFKKEQEIMICYRGTDNTDFGGQDMTDNRRLAWHDSYSNHLTATVLFYEKIKKDYGEGCNLHLTGHSLGGALSQFICVYSGGIHTTKTFNGLGIGIHQSIFKRADLLDFYDPDVKIERSNGNDSLDRVYLGLKELLKQHGTMGCLGLKQVPDYLDNEIKIISQSKEREEISENQYDNFRLRLKNLLEEYRPKGNAEKQVEELYWMLKAKDNFRIGLEKIFSKTEDNKIIGLISTEVLINYYNKEDAISLIQTRIGKIIDVYEKTQSKNIDVINDGGGRVITENAVIDGVAFHSINDYILFLNEAGNIEPGKIGTVFLKNLVKTSVLEYKKENKDKWQEMFNSKPENKTYETNIKNQIGVQVKIFLDKLEESDKKEEEKLKTEEEKLKKNKYLQGGKKFDALLLEEYNREKVVNLISFRRLEKGYDIEMGHSNNLERMRGIEGGFYEVVGK